MNATTNHPSKQALGSGARRLVELMQRIGFGRIEQLRVSGGEPTFTPMPRVVREVRLGPEHAGDPVARSADFALKKAVVDLLAELRAIGDGAAVSIEVRHGLPHRLLVQEVANG
ncbi:MAG TPA: hypothetical protein PKE29_10190 [Phycisphaerales bacterium]|nr:hypothetical protein [Phycisphaerales bacterium]